MESIPPFTPRVTHPAFFLFGPERPASPLVVAVPHAGRYYPPGMLERAQVTLDVLRQLEDRYADLLAHGLIAAGHSVLVARTARAWMDYNRDEADIDPGMVDGMPRGEALRPSAKMRGGLGLIPRRSTAAGGALWRGRFAWADIARRVREAHRPYHAALAERLSQARAAFGQALLIDLHSMPPLARSGIQLPADVVLGDRFGQSCGTQVMAMASGFFEGQGLMTVQNHPYAGSYGLDRHGRPSRCIHAFQCEVDRRLYLDEALNEPGDGLARMQRCLARLGEVMTEFLTPDDLAEAAE